MLSVRSKVTPEKNKLKLQVHLGSRKPMPGTGRGAGDIHCTEQQMANKQTNKITLSLKPSLGSYQSPDNLQNFLKVWFQTSYRKCKYAYN